MPRVTASTASAPVSLKPYDADGSLVREAIAAFLRDGPKYLAAMHDAFGASDGSAVATAAHALKGAVRALKPLAA